VKHLHLMNAANEILELRMDRFNTPIGELFLVADGEGKLRLIGWAEDETGLQHYLKHQMGKKRFRVSPEADPSGLTSILHRYFGGDLKVIDALPVETGGTDFQREVWEALRTIPCGTTISYGELARQIGRPNAVRAVGLANGSNPIPIVVPCHRVIGSDRSLTGYGGGLERKRWLLEHEKCTGVGVQGSLPYKTPHEASATLAKFRVATQARR
jgi:methylated-DNA-[protein]-cysteine S-methyltransferase